MFSGYIQTNLMLCYTKPFMHICTVCSYLSVYIKEISILARYSVSFLANYVRSYVA